MSQQIGWLVINVTAALFLLVDIYLWKLDNIENNTWSQIIINKSKKHIYYPFLWGCLMGHWFL